MNVWAIYSCVFPEEDIFMYACIHVFMYSCIDTKALPPGMDPKLPMYVCFEIFRVRIELMGTLYCKHSDAMQYPKDPSQENESFMPLLR